VLNTANFLQETANVSKRYLIRDRKSKGNKIFSGNKLHQFGAETHFGDLSSNFMKQAYCVGGGRESH
jgi:hypothetical protein